MGKGTTIFFKGSGNYSGIRVVAGATMTRVQLSFFSAKKV